MSNIFVTSDLHFMHNKPFLFEPRGFTTTEEMCATIVERWNSTVQDDDIVYNLGDIALSDLDAAIPYLQQLRGQIKWISGNHDTTNKVTQITANCPNIENIGYATQIKSGKWSFFLCHYPVKVGNYTDEEYHTKMYCLCGHTHTKDKFLDIKDKCYHVEMDAHDCYPVNLEVIKQDLIQYALNSKNEVKDDSPCVPCRLSVDDKMSCYGCPQYFEYIKNIGLQP